MGKIVVSGKPIESLTEYIEVIEENTIDHNMVLFRGQRKQESLLPKIARDDTKLKENILKSEKEMFEEFKRRSRPFVDSKPEYDLEWLALAQHYGLITRLLDWTKNALAALWFVVSKPALSSQDGIVWLFSVNKSDFVKEENEENPFDIQKTKVFQPSHIARRIIAQDGWFTLHAVSKKQNKFVALNNNLFYRTRIKCFAISKKWHPDIRKELNLCGINYSSLFPELTGICRHIVMENTFMPDDDKASVFKKALLRRLLRAKKRREEITKNLTRS